MDKTNAMRILDQKKIPYLTHEYPHDGDLCVIGTDVARLLNQDPNKVFKTLVTTYNNHYYVCVIPVASELDLKKAASYFKVKSLDMVHVKDLLWITGYIGGSCSPIGMKKSFDTIVDESILKYDSIIFSGGKIGLQIEMKPKDLERVIKVRFLNIIREG